VSVQVTALIYLLGFYWPYLLGALAIGIVAGWFSYARPKA
jgi:hypothetical protein